MKNSILNLGKALNKAEQKNIQGGKIALTCGTNVACEIGYNCGPFGCEKNSTNNG